MSTFYQNIKANWSKAWKNDWFRNKIITAFSTVVLILTFLPFFFDWIEARSGSLLNDWLLEKIAPTDVSIGVFSLLWGSGLWLAYKGIQNPYLLLNFLAGYAVLTLMRIVTITVFPLEPPIGLIVLQDPISNQFYGNSFITKDLFFSGHTSAVFLIAFCLKEKTERIVVNIAACLVGVFVLMLHIHYTIDVLAAPPLTYLCYWMGKKWIAAH